MNLKDLTDQQRQVLLDLALLAMYADGHLASVEDERVHRLLSSMGWTDELDRNKQYDAAISRISRHSLTANAARAHVATLADSFTTPDQRRRVHGILDDLVSSDSRIAPQESSYLAIVKEALKI